eukprot:jgi/Mesen1/88/ME1112859C05680
MPRAAHPASPTRRRSTSPKRTATSARRALLGA